MFQHLFRSKPSFVSGTDGFGYAVQSVNRLTGRLVVRVSVRGYVSHFTDMSWDEWDHEIEPLRPNLENTMSRNEART